MLNHLLACFNIDDTHSQIDRDVSLIGRKGLSIFSEGHLTPRGDQEWRPTRVYMPPLTHPCLNRLAYRQGDDVSDFAHPYRGDVSKTISPLSPIYKTVVSMRRNPCLL
jgi:hypothetical protein